MLLPNIHLYSLFLMKLHPFTFLLLICFALNSSVPELVFLFTLSGSSVFSFKESIDFGTIRKNNTMEKQPESLQSGF